MTINLEFSDTRPLFDRSTTTTQSYSSMPFEEQLRPIRNRQATQSDANKLRMTSSTMSSPTEAESFRDSNFCVFGSSLLSFNPSNSRDYASSSFTDIMQAQPVVNGAFEVNAEIEPQDRLAHFDDSDDTDNVGDFDYLNQSQTKQSRVISPGNCLPNC